MSLIHPVRIALRTLVASLALILWFIAPAAAQTCDAQVTDFNFGTVSLRAGAVNQTTGSVTIDCRGGLLGGLAQPVGICLTFGGGSASDGGSPPRRYMTGPGGSLLEYQLRQFGNGTSGGTLTTLFVEVVVLAGRGSATVPIYADILTRSVALPTGPYSASFSGSGASGVRMKVGVLACNLLGSEQSVPGFFLRADVSSSCEVTTTPLDFGNVGVQINGPVDETATIEVRCTNGTPYRVSLGLGSGPGVTAPERRKMRSLLGTLSYGLFQDAGRSVPWGETQSSSVAGNGIGAAQIFTVFGRIFGNQTAPAGIYTDNVVVTIAY